MTITNTWNVVQMDVYPEKDGEEEVAFTVHWDLIGTNDIYSGRVYGSVGVNLDPDQPFTPYEELTQEQVIGWVKDALGEDQVTSYEENVAQQIKNQINPPVITPPLPWVVPDANTSANT
jgi:hypothetical protein